MTRPTRRSPSTREMTGRPLMIFVSVKAMQLAIDLPGIAKNYYKGSVEPYPSSLTSRALKGWGFPYEEWPQDLKDEYAYNPTLARKLLADAGYPHGFKTNIVADTTGDLDLLQVVKSYFADVGIDMEIRPMDSTEWIAYVLNGHQARPVGAASNFAVRPPT